MKLLLPLIVVPFILMCTNFAYGKINDTSKRVSIHSGIFLNNTEKIQSSMIGEDIIQRLPVFNLSINYKALKNLEGGCYMAYSTMGHKVSPTKPMYFPSNTYYYGVMASYDFLGLITSKSNLRIKLCASTNIGVVSAKWTEGDGENWTESWNGPFPEYGAGISASYFFTKWLGISMAYSVGRFYNKDNSRLSYGITLKI